LNKFDGDSLFYVKYLTSCFCIFRWEDCMYIVFILNFIHLVKTYDHQVCGHFFCKRQILNNSGKGSIDDIISWSYTLKQENLFFKFIFFYFFSYALWSAYASDRNNLNTKSGLPKWFVVHLQSLVTEETLFKIIINNE
jgi:hypothetical protein